jgi:hypothetical protein
MANQNARWSEASDVIPMFPTLVWKIELEAQLREGIGARVLAALARLRRDLPPLAPACRLEIALQIAGATSAFVMSAQVLIESCAA